MGVDDSNNGGLPELPPLPVPTGQIEETPAQPEDYAQPHLPQQDTAVDEQSKTPPLGGAVQRTPYLAEDVDQIVARYSGTSNPPSDEKETSGYAINEVSANKAHWQSSIGGSIDEASLQLFDTSMSALEAAAAFEAQFGPPIQPVIDLAPKPPANAAITSVTENATIGQQSANDDLEDEDEGADDALLDPDNPLMKRVQDALFRQLTEQENKLVNDIKDKEENYKKTIKRREEVGVELYNTQQQLARLQALLEGAQENMTLIKNYKEEAERTLNHTSLRHAEEKKKRSSHESNLDKHKQELESIAQTLKQVDLYNDELRSKILVAKRTTLKAEEEIIKAETEKKRQDYYIDNLTDQLRRLQERRALYETQLVAQQKETQAAHQTLQDAATEMEAIHFEKRQLVHQWKSSLIGLQRRDEVIRNIESGIQRNKDTILSLQGEINGFRLAMRKTQEQSETVTLLLGKLEGEIEHLKRQIASVEDRRDGLMEQYNLYTKTLQQLEAEMSQVNQLIQERQALQLEIAAVVKITKQTANQIAKIESDIAENLQNQTAIEKGALGTRRDNGRLRATIHEKEAAIAVALNDIGGIKLEELNTGARIKFLKSNVSGLDKELEEKNDLIEKYELEIRRRNDELGKKQAETAALNKKYDQLVGRNQDESMGPLEATIHNVTKLVQQKEKECMDLQQFWLRVQNELVSMSKKSGELQESTSELRLRLAVLSRKKALLNTQFESESKEIREHQRNIRNLQNGMVKINTLLSKQSRIQTVLAENNLGLEQEFRGRLKEAELESLHTEARIEELREEKRKTLDSLVETERQLMLWEKKIQLAKETQAALDPNVGATEMKEMSIEIHRMKLRYASMLKVQEKMIAEMEKSNKDIGLLLSTKATLETHLSDSKQVAEQLSLKERENAAEVESSEHMRRLLMNETVMYQKHVRRFAELAEGKYAFVIKDESARAPELDKQSNRLEKLGRILTTVMLTRRHSPLLSQATCPSAQLATIRLLPGHLLPMLRLSHTHQCMVNRLRTTVTAQNQANSMEHLAYLSCRKCIDRTTTMVDSERLFRRILQHQRTPPDHINNLQQRHQCTLRTQRGSHFNMSGFMDLCTKIPISRSKPSPHMERNIVPKVMKVLLER
ncbi:Coiled-coil domain-containing protein 40 [Cladochytrium tenue]|nr:Coiled-coil domain-containing protein 40 [Cladochytrium tenue]